MPLRRVAIMRVEVTTPEQWLGDVLSDLTHRHGRIVAMEEREPGQCVRALVALSERVGYARTLHALPGGHGPYDARLSHWVISGGDEPDTGAGVASPARPIGPNLESGAAAELPPGESSA